MPRRGLLNRVRQTGGGLHSIRVGELADLKKENPVITIIENTKNMKPETTLNNSFVGVTSPLT